MSLIVKDRVMETSTSTSTGDFVLSGAYTGFRAFSDVCSTSDTVFYMIEGLDSLGYPSGEWECGYGTYSAANTLTRTIVQDSSNAGAAVNFSAGTKRVSITQTATQFKFRGCLAKLNADQTTQNYATAAAIAWDGADEYDTDNIHNPASNNTRLSVPSGVTLVELRAGLFMNLVQASEGGLFYFTKNGVANVFVGGAVSMFYTSSAPINPGVSIVSPPITVVGGTDYFETVLDMQADTSITIKSNISYFGMRILA